MHFKDRLQCDATLEAANIQALTITDSMAMKDEYLKAKFMVDEVSGLIPVVVAKL